MRKAKIKIKKNGDQFFFKKVKSGFLMSSLSKSTDLGMVTFRLLSKWDKEPCLRKQGNAFLRQAFRPVNKVLPMKLRKHLLYLYFMLLTYAMVSPAVGETDMGQIRFFL